MRIANLLMTNRSTLLSGLAFAVQLKDRQFTGRAALVQLKQAPRGRKRIGLEMDGRRVPREHFAVFDGDRPVGEVTSGTFSPSCQRPIAMAYVDTESASVGQTLAVDIRGSRLAARVVELPFYSKSS